MNNKEIYIQSKNYMKLFKNNFFKKGIMNTI